MTLVETLAHFYVLIQWGFNKSTPRVFTISKEKNFNIFLRFHPQILEELENLEETLNDSIRESLGARGKLSTGKKKGGIEEEDEYLR